MADHTTRRASPNGFAICYSLVLLVCWLATAQTPVAATELRDTPIVKAVKRVRASVVNIRGEKTVAQAAAGEPSHRVNGMGTGVVIDSRGYILTNHHVVENVHDIIVTTAEGKRFTARLVARDSETDLAIIKIDSPDLLPEIPIGVSSDLMPGETVIALGNAYGYEHTVTRGIVSALHRAVQVSDAQFYDNLIQTDASINPGNSGGPLLNIDGDMIGINVAVRAGAQGIGFAIPADTVKTIAAGMLASCGADRGWLGVVSANETASNSTGMVVDVVEPQSPAAEAGLDAGDVIVRVDDVNVEQPLDFQRAMLERKPGDSCLLTVNRSGAPLTLKVKLGKPTETTKSADKPAWDVLGLDLQPLTAEEFRKTRQTRYRGGLLVTAVRANSPASSQGIRPGDILVGMHIWETASLENVAYVLKRPDFGSISPLKFFILRDQETLYGFLPVNTPLAAAKTAQR